MLMARDPMTIEVGPRAVARVAPAYGESGAHLMNGGVLLELETAGQSIIFSIGQAEAAVLGCSILRAQLAGESWQAFIDRYPGALWQR